MRRTIRNSLVAIVISTGLGTPAAKAANINLVPPDQSVAQIPVTQFKSGVPTTLPSTNGHPAVGTVFAIQSYSSSQQTPTSPRPGTQVCVQSGQCTSQAACVNAATWPSVADSISWWQSQNQNLKGTYAYQVGSTYSHQDAEGWIDHCKPQPSCPSGYTGGYSWNGSNWVNGCQAPPKPCPTGAGWTGTGQPSCHYTPRPNCPRGDTNTYSWNAGAHQWTGSCKTGVYAVIQDKGHANWGGHAGVAPHNYWLDYGITKAEYDCAASAIIPAHREYVHSGRRQYWVTIPAQPMYDIRTTLNSQTIRWASGIPGVYVGMPVLANAPYATFCGPPVATSGESSY